MLINPKVGNSENGVLSLCCFKKPGEMTIVG